jgi:hypothetical protein
MAPPGITAFVIVIPLRAQARPKAIGPPEGRPEYVRKQFNMNTLEDLGQTLLLFLLA